MNILLVVSIIGLERNKRENRTTERSVFCTLIYYNLVSISGMCNKKPIVADGKTIFMKTDFAINAMFDSRIFSAKYRLYPIIYNNNAGVKRIFLYIILF